MSLERISVPLKNIYPSDTPRLDAWKETLEQIPEIDASLPFFLGSIGVTLSFLEREVFSLMDGNHRVARVYQLLGPDTEVEADLYPENEQSEFILYKCRTSLANEYEINTFQDFLNVLESSSNY